MSKKKKNRNKNNGGGEVKKPNPDPWHKSLKPETKHSLWAVFSFVVAALFTLAYFGKAGLVGNALQKSLEATFGRGFFLVPLAFFLGGFSFLFAIGNHLVATTVIGGILFLFSSLGLADIVFGEYTGGYFGFFTSYPFLRFFDYWASIVILSAILLASLMIMLNFSLRPRKKEVTDEIPADALAHEHFTPPAVPQTAPVRQAPAEPQSQPDIESVADEEVKSSIFSKVFSSVPKPKPARVEPQRQVLYDPPPLELLESDKGTPSSGDIKANANIIKRTFQNFGIDVEMSEVSVGPSVTQYTLKPAEGIKLSRITSLQNDLALALAAHPLRIEAPIPGKSLVGIEIPNRSIALVGLRNIIGLEDFQKAAPLSIALGRDVTGTEVYSDIAKMPHLLIAGATGSGKSITIHTLIVSLLYKNSPQFLRFMMVDPKRVELSAYNNIPHLLTPVITDAKKTIASLRWAVREMEDRYQALSSVAARDINSFNTTMIKDKQYDKILPNIVIIIDELADLMAAYPREMEASIVRLAQMSRAVGIHLVVSTQRPSVEVITGLIKANITSRIALQVASGVDSRTILDMTGAEKLLGHGDMLYLAGDTSKPRRIQGAFISENEVKKITNYLKDRAEQYEVEEVDMDLKLPPSNDPNAPSDFMRDGDDVDDELYEEAKETVIEAQKASTSYLQRKLRIGYARAASIIDMLEERGVVGHGEGAKPREVLIKKGEGDAADKLIRDFEAQKKYEEKEMQKALKPARVIRQEPPAGVKNSGGDDDDGGVPYTNFDF